MSEGTEYRFTINKDVESQGNNRFELGVQPAETPISTAVGASLKVLLLPNPATETVNISFSATTKAPTSIRILSISGVCVYSNTLGMEDKGTVSIPVNTLAAGVYMVEFTSGNEKVLQRMIKE